jgi:hypothetical protein
MSIKQKNSKIFVRNVTVLDCGVWDKTRGPVGRSWNVDVEWHGTTDEEGVVVDFQPPRKSQKTSSMSNSIIVFSFQSIMYSRAKTAEKSAFPTLRHFLKTVSCWRHIHSHWQS